MKFDDALGLIGEFGTYQKRLYFLLCLPSINAGIFMTISVFLLGTPDHRCAIPGFEEDTWAVQNESDHGILINKTIPYAGKDEKFLYDQCHVFVGNISDYDNHSQPITAEKIKCSKWVYDKTNFRSTFVTEKDLVCNKDFLPTLSKMLFFAGVLVGAFVFGLLSDAIGRKKTLFISFFIVVVTSVALAWAPNYALFVVLRFLIGAGNAGIFMTAFVIGMELVGPSKRMWAGIVIEYFFAVGLVVLAGVAYGLREWKHIEMAVGFPNILYLSYWWLIPESPRWLLSQGRISEAEDIIRKAGEVNKVTLPEQIFDEKTVDTSGPQGKIWHLFGSRVLLIRTLVIFFNWMVVSMVYYGLSLNTGNLGGNFYLNFTISGLVEFPAYTLCILFLDRVGRKRLHFLAMTLGGVACISTVFTTIFGGEDLHALTVTLAMVGKVGAAAAFAVIYVFSAELYPTVVRNAGMGASSCCARIGGIAAPYIADLNKVVPGDFGSALPLVIFGSASVAAGVLSLLLPETLNKDLPETIEDGKNFGKSIEDVKEQINVAFTEDNEQEKKEIGAEPEKDTKL